MIKESTAAVILLIILVFSSCRNHSYKHIDLSGSTENNFTVALLTYENFDTALVAFVNKEVEEFYHCKVIILPSVKLPSFAFYPLRNRYKADSLLLFEKQSLKENIDAIAGLTIKDISTKSGKIPDWGVFGLGMCPGKVCIISTYRLERASKTIAQLKERLIKVVLHELGHNLGLLHCTNNPECMMTDAGGTIQQVDREKKWLCESCRLKLRK